MFHKSLQIFAAASMLALAGTAVADSQVQTMLDGRVLSFDQPAIMQDGRVMVPLRGIFESLGADVLFDNRTRTIKATKGDRVVELTLGSREARINGATSYLDVPASTMGGRTLVPLRFVSESLGADVRWMPSTRTVALTSSGTPSDLNNLPSQPPVAASETPKLRNLVHSARSPLREGDRLVVSFNGDSGGQASFDLMGIANGIPMREVSNGRYEGDMVVRQGMNVEKATLVARLRRGDKEGVLESRRAVSIDYGNNNNNNNNNNNAQLSPAQGSVVYNSRPTVHAELNSNVRNGSTRIYLDGNEVTGQSSVNGSSVNFVPNYDLTNGDHRISIQAVDNAGRNINRDWTFTVNANNNNNNNNNGNNWNNSNVNNLNVTNLSSGANVSGIFNLQGQTAPYAQVQLVAQSQRSLIPGVIGMQSRVATVNRQADANGRFDMQVDISRVPVNTPVTLDITSTDQSGRASSPVRLDVVRR